MSTVSEPLTPSVFGCRPLAGRGLCRHCGRRRRPCPLDCRPREGRGLCLRNGDGKNGVGYCRPREGRGLCLYRSVDSESDVIVAVPLRGVGCVVKDRSNAKPTTKLPSPCGAWAVSHRLILRDRTDWLPSPCGAWAVSVHKYGIRAPVCVAVPLRGVGCVL